MISSKKLKRDCVAGPLVVGQLRKLPHCRQRAAAEPVNPTGWSVLWEIGADYKSTLLTENAFGSDPAD
jgi:hypothetical protein